jgi:hypothetical protein
MLQDCLQLNCWVVQLRKHCANAPESVRTAWVAGVANVTDGELLTLQVPWQVPARVSQFITQVAKACDCGLLGDVGDGVGAGCAIGACELCAMAQATLVNRIPTASRYLI